ncbi:MAG: HIT family protein [Desulfarculales bacterium]|nr:HIT family protein [Desulfarculales bacterium]
MSDVEKTCIFCEIVSRKIPCVKIYEDERTIAFADINPLVGGHSLVIPKTHAVNLMDITPGDLAAVHQSCQRVGAAIMKAFKAPGLAVLQLNGSAAGQTVMHYHVHLIPRLGAKDKIGAFTWPVRAGNPKIIEKNALKIISML